MTPLAGFELTMLLLAATVVLRVAGRRIGLPPASALTLGGLAIALAPGVPRIALDPDLTLALFLPPLVFSGAYFTDWRAFRDDLRIILQLAIGAILFTTLFVGWVAHVALGLPYAIAFALGAIVSPPDTVAAKAVLAPLGLPKRIVTLLEGESLVNDATGIVVYRLAIAAALTGTFSPGHAILTFFWLASGGIALGAAAGWVGAWLLAQIDEPDLNTVTSLLFSWMLYLGAEALGVSGVLATVAGGLVLGRRQHRLQDAAARLRAQAVWATVTFTLESLVFVVIGLQLNAVIGAVEGGWTGAMLSVPSAVYVVTAVVAARFIWIVPTTYLVRAALPSLRRRDPYPPFGVPVIMSWAGMRGVVSLAIATALPAATPSRDLLILCVFAVILFTVLVQGTTLGLIARRFRIQGFVLGVPQTLSEAEARLRLAERQAAAAHLAARDQRSSKEAAGRFARRAEAVRAHAADPEHLDHGSSIARAALDAGRQALLAMHAAGEIDDDVMARLEMELDVEDTMLNAR